MFKKYETALAPHQGQQPHQRSDAGPPDLDQMLARLFRGVTRVGKQGGPMGPSFKLLGFLLALVLSVWLVSGFFIVSPAEQAVVLFLGKYQKTLGPGPHWIPRLLASSSVVDVQRIGTFSYNADMLTQDENIVFVSLSVQYRIDHPRDFLFNVVNPFVGMRQATASALRQVIGHTTLDDILTTGRTVVRAQVAAQIDRILQPYKTGILVTDVNLQPAKPPEEVTEAFDDAIKAREDEQTYINQAQAYAERVVPIAQGQAKRMLREAEAFKEKVILQAQADTISYLSLLPAYQEAPEIMKKRMYLQTMESVLSQTSKVLMDTQNGHNLVYLPLDQLFGRTPKMASDALVQSPPVSVEKSPTEVVRRFPERQSFSR